MSSFVRSRAAAAVLAAALLGFGAAGCGASPTAGSSAATTRIVVVDDAGHRVVLAHPVHRLVVIEPSNFEILDAMGLRQDVVGVDSSVPRYTPAPWQSAAKGIPSIGSAVPAPSAERVLALHPQLVIASTPLSDLKALTALHIPVMVLDPTSLAGVYHDIALVGQVTGHAGRAAALVAQLKRNLAGVTARLAGIRTRPTLFYDLGQLYTTGRGTFLTAMIGLAGGRNALAGEVTGWPQVTAEQVVRANPDYILIDSGAGVTPAQEENYAGFASTTAAHLHHILVVPNSSYLDQPSIGIWRGVLELARILHPARMTGYRG